MEISQLFNVQGKKVLITGGGTGIGYMIAKGFVQNGADVIISSRKDNSAVAEELSSLGPGSCSYVQADMTQEAGRATLAAAVGGAAAAAAAGAAAGGLFGGRLDVLVNNAGANWAAPLEAYPPAAFAKVVGLNLAAPFLLAQTMLPFLSAAASPGNPSRIINIGSIEGLKVSSFETYAYGASKSGLHHLTKMLANKLGPRHITVNAIAPGTFQSKMMRATIQKFGDELVSNVPLGRLGSEEDMAGTSLWLSSRGGAFVTGSVIVVDGGFTVFSSKL